MPPAENPFASPQAELKAPAALSPQAEAEKIRREYLGHEASIQSVGFLCHVGGGILLTALLGIYFLLCTESGTLLGKLTFGAVSTLLCGGLAALLFWLGAGLRGLKRRVVLPMAILSGIGLLAFPIGTLLGAYMLFLLYTKSGKTVFSDEYKRIIFQTPHIQYRS